jgi:hypothetical protein
MSLYSLAFTYSTKFHIKIKVVITQELRHFNVMENVMQKLN